MTLAEECRTVLLDDEPALDDAFSSEDGAGAHDQVAAAIADTLQNSIGGKVIGLSGGWGSGKSTVVNLVSKRLAKDADFRAITFDAWAHEGDPLRRTFLESLASSLKSANWIDCAKWRERLDYLSNRRKTVSTETTRQPTPFGLCMAISLFAVPPGSVLLTDALRGYDLALDGAIVGQVSFGLAMVFSPLAVLLIRVLSLLPATPSSWRKPLTLKRLKNIESWAFLDGRSDARTVSNTSETPNPTSIEFARTFRELLSDALSTKPRRRILIVIDNLDRADLGDALRIWSTMQTFLHDNEIRKDEWFGRLWILVPYDPVGLRKLWDRDSELPDRSTSTIDLESSSQHLPSSRGAADSFIEKSFQVRFQVPPLIYSDWKFLLVRLLASALPNHNPEDFHSVYQVVDSFRGDGVPTPTPRQLKAIVNQIGVYHRLRKHEFPLAHIAYFVLQRTPAMETVSRLRTGTSPEPDAVRLLGDDLKRSMAGLVFNVSAKRGMELLLSDSIHELLTKKNDDVSQLLAMSNEHANSFWQTLERIAARRLADTAPIYLGRFARRLFSSGLLEGKSTPEKRSIVNAIRLATETVTEWTPFDAEMGNGVAALLRIVPERGYARNLFSAVQATLKTFHANAGTATGTGHHFGTALVAIFESLSATGSNDLIPEPIEVPVSAMEWMHACTALESTDPENRYWSKIRPSCSDDEVTAFIASLVSEGRSDANLSRLMRVSKESLSNIDWSRLQSTFRGRLDAGQNPTPEEVNWLLPIYAGMPKNAKQSRAFDELTNNGHILHHFHRSTREKHQSCRAICAYFFLKKFPNCSAPPGSNGDSASGHKSLEGTLSQGDNELVDVFLHTLRDMQDSQLVFAIVSGRGRLDPFITQLLGKILDAPFGKALIAGEDIQRHWKLLKDNLSNEDNQPSFGRILKLGLEEHDLGRAISESPDGFKKDQIPLYIALCEMDGSPRSENFSQWCSGELAKFSKEEWENDFSEGFAAVQLLLVLTRRGLAPALSAQFADALESHSRSLARGAIVPPAEIAGRWSKVVQAIENSAVRLSLRESLIRVAAMFRDGDLRNEFFALYSDELQGISRATSDLEPLMRVLIALIKHRRPANGLQWAERILSEETRLQEHYLFDELRERVREGLQIGSEDFARTSLQRIGELIGAKLETPRSESH